MSETMKTYYLAGGGVRQDYDSPTPQSMVVEPYLDSNYKTVFEDGGVRIMERKVEVDAGN